MGGTPIGLITSVIGLISGGKTPEVPDNSAALDAERRAKEEAQRKKEAEGRKRNRDKVIEARTAEKSATASTGSKSTLASGSAGLTGEAAVSTKQLKQKLGE